MKQDQLMDPELQMLLGSVRTFRRDLDRIEHQVEHELAVARELTTAREVDLVKARALVGEFETLLARVHDLSSKHYYKLEEQILRYAGMTDEADEVARSVEPTQNLKPIPKKKKPGDPSPK